MSGRAANRRAARALVFDGDDTLWHTEWLYDAARRRARGIVERAGLDGDLWEARERLIDVANVARFGHAAERFPTSCAEAYEEACVAAGLPIDEDVRKAVVSAAGEVFERRAPLVEGVEETLVALRGRGFLLGLLTKGDLDVQRWRVEHSGLEHLFDRVEIVEEKTPESILALFEHLGADAATGYAIGNSVRSDVLPSLAAGVTPIWIDAHVWEYEREHGGVPLQGVIKKEDLRDLLKIDL